MEHSWGRLLVKRWSHPGSGAFPLSLVESTSGSAPRGQAFCFVTELESTEDPVGISGVPMNFTLCEAFIVQCSRYDRAKRLRSKWFLQEFRSRACFVTSRFGT